RRRIRDRLQLPETEIARIATRHVPGAAEVLDERAMTADTGHAERVHLLHLTDGHGELTVVGDALLEDARPGHRIARVVQQHALRRQAVTAGAARLLLIVLDRLRHPGVHDKANVRAVDTHPERHRGHDD